MTEFKLKLQNFQCLGNKMFFLRWCFATFVKDLCIIKSVYLTMILTCLEFFGAIQIIYEIMMRWYKYSLQILLLSHPYYKDT